MDEKTTNTFEEARRQLFDPDVEDEDIRVAEAGIRQAEVMLSRAQTSPQNLQILEERIKSRKQWISTLREIQRQKIQRRIGIRQFVD